MGGRKLTHHLLWNGGGRMRRVFFLLFLVLQLSGCGRSADQTLAALGTINEDAPVKAVTQIVIGAPVSRVWNILADIRNWPAWQSDINTVSISQEPAIGVAFAWSTAAGTIHSRLALFEPESRLAWTGRLLIFHAIHIWILTSLPNGQTLVQTRESMSGWPIGLFYPSADLLSADHQWLVDLKKKAES